MLMHALCLWEILLRPHSCLEMSGDHSGSGSARLQGKT